MNYYSSTDNKFAVHPQSGTHWHWRKSGRRGAPALRSRDRVASRASCCRESDVGAPRSAASSPARVDVRAFKFSPIPSHPIQSSHKPDKPESEIGNIKDRVQSLVCCLCALCARGSISKLYMYHVYLNKIHTRKGRMKCAFIE